MMEDDSGDDLLLACASPNQDVIGAEDSRLLTSIDDDTSVTASITEVTDIHVAAGVEEVNSTHEIPRSHATSRQDSMDFSTPQTVVMTQEAGVDLTDDIVDDDEAIDLSSEDVGTYPATSTNDNTPNPHYYVGYIPDDIPERIRPFVVDTTVGVDVAGNNLPDNYDFTSLWPCTSNQAGAGAPLSHDIEDNSDTDTAPGTDDECI